MKNKNASNGKWQNNKKKSSHYKGDSKPNATPAKKIVQFAPVSKDAKFAPFSVVKEAFLLEVQQLPLKSLSLIVESLQNETMPNFRTMRPLRFKVSWDTQNGRMRIETMAQYTMRVTQEHQRVMTRQQQQQGQQAAPAQQEPPLSEDIKEMIKDQ